MPMNYLISPVQQSGSPNVPLTESTGAQLQGTEGAGGNLGNILGSSASGSVIANPELITANVVCSGNLTVNNQTIINTSFISGTTTAGLVISASVVGVGSATAGQGVVISGAASVSALATNSGGGLNAPAGFFFINVPTSGSPWVKVPFYNS